MHHNYLLACQNLDYSDVRQIIWKIRSKKVILATGSIERPLTFHNNDRPGILLSHSARYYANRKINLGRNIVLFTNNDYDYHTAINLINKNSSKNIIIIDLLNNTD